MFSWRQISLELIAVPGRCDEIKDLHENGKEFVGRCVFQRLGQDGANVVGIPDRITFQLRQDYFCAPSGKVVFARTARH
jgi:hypothetical protein